MNMHAHHRTVLASKALKVLLSSALTAGVLGGCASHSGVSVRKNGAEPVALSSGSELLPAPNLSPVFSPLDRVRVQIQATAGPEGLLIELNDSLRFEFSVQDKDYHVLPGDELVVRFGGDPKLDFTVVVRPDGRIALQDLGELTVLGRTPEQLSNDVNERYRERLRQPSAQVTVQRSSLTAGELRGEALVQDDGSIAVPRLGRVNAAGLSVAKLSQNLSELATARLGTQVSVQVSREQPRIDRQKEGLVGFDKPVVIGNDGRLVLPELGSLEAAGKTVEQVQAQVAASLKARYRNQLSISLFVEASEARVVYVGGEVGRPGAYPLVPGMTMLRALLLAGGTSDNADMTRVVLLRRDAQNDVYVYLSNLNDFIKQGVRENDLSLTPQDIVLVSKTGVAKANLWIDQYINRMLPFSRSVGYSYNKGETVNQVNTSAGK